jgi:tRNA(Ile)-lysidine synthase
VSSRKKTRVPGIESLAAELDRLPGPFPRAVLLAFSGGLDSTVLLHLLAGLREHREIRVRAVHFDHGISPHSQSWARHCVRVCDELGIPLQVERLHLRPDGQGLEAAARSARYAFLENELEVDELLLTAHHRDDQSETLLLRLFRGAGGRGLAGLLPVRDFSCGRIARPLLRFTRAGIHAYGTEHALRWVDDDSNVDTRFDRNHVRHAVLPALRSRWPGVDAVLARTAGLLADQRLLLEERAREDWQLCRKGDDLVRSACARLSDPRLRNLLVHWLVDDPPSMHHIEEIVHQVRHPSGTGRAIVRWPGGEVRRYRDLLQRGRTPANPAPFEFLWDPTGPLEIPAAGIILHSRAVLGAGLARDRLPAGLWVRNRQGGERYRLPGQSHSRPVKKLLQEAGIPPWERERLPFFFVGEELAAIGDRWICAPYAARAGEPGFALRIERKSE